MRERRLQQNTILAVALVVSGCHGLQRADKQAVVPSEALFGSIEIAPDAEFHMQFPGLRDFTKARGQAGWYCGLRDSRALHEIVSDSDGYGLQQEQEGNVPLRVCDVFYWHFSQYPNSQGLPALKRYHGSTERDRLIAEALALLDSREYVETEVKGGHD